MFIVFYYHNSNENKTLTRKRSTSHLSFFLANKSTTISALIAHSLDILNNYSPDKQLVVIVFLRYVFTLCIVEKDLSDVAADTGIAKKTAKHILTL